MSKLKSEIEWWKASNGSWYRHLSETGFIFHVKKYKKGKWLAEISIGQKEIKIDYLKDKKFFFPTLRSAQDACLIELMKFCGDLVKEISDIVTSTK